MKKRILSFLTLLCMITALLPANVVFAATSGYYTYTVSNGEATITACDTSISGNITIPSTLGNYPVTKIGYNVFHDCQNLTGLTIPDTIISIDTNSIWTCKNLKTLTIGKNLTEIEDNVFCNLYSLETINWNAENLTYLIDGTDDNYVFDGVGKNSNGVTIIFGDNVKSIPEWAFNPDDEDPNISKIVMGKNIQKIGKKAFKAHSQSEKCYSVYIDSLENYLSIEFEDRYSYPTISANELYVNGNLVTELNIPEGVEYLSRGLIGQNKTITQINIPSSISSIEMYAFSSCAQLKEINVATNNACYSSVSGVLFNKDKTELVSIVTDKENLTNYTVPDKVTTIKEGAFSGCGNLTSITLPTSITKIEKYAFPGNEKLETVYFNGTKEDFSIDASASYTNYSYYNAKKVYLKCRVILNDNNGNEISNKIQNYGGIVDTSSITVPDGYALKLYKDQALTEEYSLDTPISENLNLYYDIIEINKLKITGTETADIGQKGITESVTFATDKTAKDFVATIKYSDKLNFVKANSEIFDIEADEYTDDEQKYLSLTCTYKNDGNMPKNTTLNAFDLVFDVSESATANEKMTIEFIDEETFLADSGANTYDFDGLGTAEIKINPILVKSVTINGADEIDKATQYTAVILPENATNKDIEWTVDNSDIATISVDGILTPVKAGTVKIKATAKGGNDVYAEKLVNVKVYATITSLTASVGEWDKTFTPSEREYTIYVPKNTASIKLKPQYNGTLKLGTQTLYNNRNNNITLSNLETVLTLNYSETGYTDSEYKIKIVKFEGTKTTVSEDGKSFTIKPINIANGNTVILALYNGEEFVTMQSAVYSGYDIPFTVTDDYTTAKVMVWNNLDDITPICDVEIVK